MIRRKIIKIVATRCHILKLKCTSAPPDLLAGFKRSNFYEKEGEDGGKKGLGGRVEEWGGLGGNGSEKERTEEREGLEEREERRGFQMFEILTASMLCGANLHHRAKFRAGRSSRSGDMAVF